MSYRYDPNKEHSPLLDGNQSAPRSANRNALRSMSYEEGANALSVTSTPGEPELLESLPNVTSTADKNVGVASRKNVEARSKRRTGDKPFETMDADYSLGYTIPRTTRETKNRRDIAVSVGLDGEKTEEESNKITKETGIETLLQYRDMILRDFNFSGVVSKFSKNAKSIGQRFRDGMTPFVKAVVERFYPGSKVDDPEVQAAVAIAKNIWSYASRGCDMNGTMDISELQGLLFVFDKEVRRSSNSNTKMKKETFIVPGTEDWETPIKLRKGDNRHGRATILTTRHLLHDMTTTPSELAGFDESHLLLDKSQSMKSDEYKKLSLLIERGGITGKVSLGGFDNDGSSLEMVENGATMSTHRAKTILAEASAGARDADGDRKHQEITGNSGMLYHEHGLHAALTLIKDMPRKKNKTQIVVATDEPDYDPACIGQLTDLAEEKNISIKILYSFSRAHVGKRLHAETANSAQRVAAREIEAGKGLMDMGPRSTHYVIIDVKKIENVKQYLFDRNDRLELKGRTADQIERGAGRYQLDWIKVAKAQGATVHEW